MKKTLLFNQRSRTWLLNIALLLSVFISSGYNPHLQSSVSPAVHSELLDSNLATPLDGYSKTSKKRCQPDVSNATFGSKSSPLFAALHHSNLLQSMLRAQWIKFISFSNPQILFSPKLLSAASADDVPAFLLA